MAKVKISPRKGKLEIVSKMTPAGDQPKAIEDILDNFKNKQNHQVLLGVTGSGKTFTMANVIQALNRPTIILAPNKTLAAQLFMEFKELFPNNAVEYFVSYYDYYQPEAYLPSSNTFIEKDSSINEQIDRMKHAATMGLFEREDVIIVSSVSCIYGLGSPEEYLEMSFELESNSDYSRDNLLKKLVKVQYDRNDIDFHRGTFRVRGDVVEIFPPYEQEKAIRVEFFGDFIEKISWVDPLRGSTIGGINKIRIYPKSHYISGADNSKRAMDTIREELLERISHYKESIMYPQAERIEQRTSYDLELIAEMGFCPGIENYSRHFTGKSSGEPPPTLLDYFPKDYLMIIDESHVTVPQVGGMFKGDQSRKTTLVEHAFRLPSALDNRPLNFPEFEALQDKVVYVSATPGEYDFKKSEGVVIEQIIRPTGLIDPEIEIKPAKHQVDDLLDEIRIRVKKKERVLVTTLTKKMSEDLAEYYEGVGVKVKYLHSDIKTFERSEILRDLRLGIFDVLIGINLLREGLDIPEVSLVAILDADKEGFLRSERSLVQTIGRAARNSEGRVILYADKMTNSMERAIKETDRRREIQRAHNKKHGITPKTIIKKISEGMGTIYSSQYSLEPSVVEASREGYRIRDVAKKIKSLKAKMKKAAENLEFEEAANLRDQLKRLEFQELSGLDGYISSE